MSRQAHFCRDKIRVCRDKTFDTMILVAAPANDTKLFFVIKTNQHRYLDCIPERRGGGRGEGHGGGRAGGIIPNHLKPSVQHSTLETLSLTIDTSVNIINKQAVT